jgi:hypothetical protein
VCGLAQRGVGGYALRMLSFRVSCALSLVLFSAGCSSGQTGAATDQVSIARLSYVSEGLTDPTGAPRFGLTLSFVLENSGATDIASLSSFSVDFGTTHAEGQLSCVAGSATWKVGAGAGVPWSAELHDRGNNGPSAINFPGQATECSSAGFGFAPAAPPPNYSGSARLTVQGALADGTQFLATGATQ